MNKKALKALALVAIPVAGLASSLVSVSPVGAYIFSSSGVTIESTDVDAVSTSAMNGVATQYEVLKFLGLFIMIGASGYVLNKVLGIKIGA